MATAIGLYQRVFCSHNSVTVLGMTFTPFQEVNKRMGMSEGMVIKPPSLSYPPTFRRRERERERERENCDEVVI